ncbi:glycerol kinase [Lactobacillus selangorensis]|uniref:ATP:glycerol 3-phosphotransferase n=1 Tax=Lactobacillus selangorensis TaxID=81857 RepID=A0A0R2G7C3_9LACO|nr:FGGY family carbohydrate kinase [Lactobacillus selangorensis]KRN28572.1 glycerol kinase [Lactobacillus selangorensis]KRN33018.1 glycerol kinase [Lactobacillus selangorensis]
MVPLTLAIDQSTQGTKVMLVESNGTIRFKTSRSHRQLISDAGWISHDLNEVENNLNELIRTALDHRQDGCIQSVAITNQRETAACWSRSTGQPLAPAIVWQDNRAEKLTDELAQHKLAADIQTRTGLALSPYFTAAKFDWLLQNVPAVQQAHKQDDLCFGTIDSWLVFILTNGQAFKTEPSNACRTQLMDLDSCEWDADLCKFFGVPMAALPTIVDSDSSFGMTNLFGLLSEPVPITSVLGDSQAALYAEGCRQAGQLKVTFGTGSSIMLNTGDQQIANIDGLNTSIAWRKQGRTTYVLEGNVNYSGAIVSWLKNNLHLIDDPAVTDEMAQQASPADTTMLIPAFSGMAAPYNLPAMKAILSGMTMLTGRNEIVRAGLNAVAYQIADILRLMRKAFPTLELVHADGGMIKNHYLMQRLSDMTQQKIAVSSVQELSGVGTALNGMPVESLPHFEQTLYEAKMPIKQAQQQIAAWQTQIAQFA